jgi:Na+-transporting NADH:ubiquinone oxidoreductase subunit A
MTHIKIRKGHNIKIAGIPEGKIQTAPSSSVVALNPFEFKYVKPKLLINEGDHVQLGSPLFFDKRNPEIKWGSPGAGVVKSIKYGERRSIRRIEIEVDKDEESIPIPDIPDSNSPDFNVKTIKRILFATNFWPHFRQRPFNKIANPEDTPANIFVSGINTSPLGVDYEMAYAASLDPLNAGLSVLSKLTDGQVHFTTKANSRLTIATDNNINVHTITDLHPAGNVGIQIHHIDPLKPGLKVWTIGIQSVVMLGNLFLKKTLDPTMYVAVGGPAVQEPGVYKSRFGTGFKALLADNLKPGKNRIVDGDVLTGRMSGIYGFLGYYNSTISVIHVDEHKPFLGWMQPGSSTRTYSLSNAFLGRRKLFSFSTKQNGNLRAIVPINAWESVLPMDILPNPLYRSILANDPEEMEQLGLLECDEEDFALCSFACPSKIDVGAVIRQGLDVLEKEA